MPIIDQIKIQNNIIIQNLMIYCQENEALENKLLFLKNFQKRSEQH
jgi:hypothetical protein